jgi:molecular chaperone GrpE
MPKKKDKKDIKEADKGQSLGKELEAENAELKDLLQRTQAELINYRQRVEREKVELIDFGKLAVIRDLLEVFDNFERARMHLPKDLKDNEWAEGMLSVEKQFAEKLKEMGIERIETKGRKFDPNLHEALMAEEKKGAKEGDITEELESGYKYGDKILRPAKVKIAK